MTICICIINEKKHNRKMGHVTLFSDVPDSVVEFGEGIDF